MSTPDPAASPAGAPPVCYRHPDRETYIRCTRCERPICPDCMISAAVGFQCPECVAEGNASVRPVRSRLGAKVPTKPYVTYTLIGLCALLFAGQTLNAFTDSSFTMWPVFVAGNDEYYRLLTSMFLHGSILHIGFNMLVLYSLGPALENLLGHVRFAALYVIAGLGGSVASFWFTDFRVQSLGASGAIFGLFGAWVVIGRRLNIPIQQILGLIAINIVIGFLVPNVDWRAHLGGLVTGAIVAAILAYAPAKGRVAYQVAGCALVIAGLWVLVRVRDQQLTDELVRLGLLAIHGGG
ncbi:MAG: rhomboid family intramembrane serine protease [Actinobacteria bacterium]|nr:rhomboid family intramembrane serine protease [Actinomycetota bacterium]